MLVIRRCGGVYSKKTEKGWVVLEKNKNYIQEMNEVGGFIWELASQPVSVDKIVDAVCVEFDVERGVVEKDIGDFVKDYISRGFLVKVNV